MTNANNCNENKAPSVKPLYFLADNKNKESTTGLLSSLPAELLAISLVDYADWGELARLACVKKSWSNLMKEAAATTGSSEWSLAQALMEGTNGLQVNHTLSLQLLHKLSGVVIQRSKKNVNVEEEDNENEEEDAFTYKIITDNPFTPAMKKLGECYLQQSNSNTEEGLAWLKAAYELGNDLEAAYELGSIYEGGKYNLAPDIYKATEWYKKAAIGGHINGMAEYALCCELGCGCDPNDEEALEWYMKAAQMGHVTAKFSVGEAFEEARGVPQSDSEACLWYYKAAMEGDDGSIAALRRLHDIARIVVPGVTNMLGE